MLATRTVLLGLAALLAAGCTSALPGSVADAPVLSVATGLWPLAQAAQAIGGDKVALDDVVPVGSNPLTYRPDAAAQKIIQSAGLVLEAGNGLQPGFEAAAQGAPTVLAVAHQLGTASPYVWLDPATMERAVGAVTDAMAAADPQAAALFRRNATGLTAEIESVRIDYSSTLSSCPGNTMVTPDRAFSDMAAAYSLTNVVIGPQPSASAVSDAKSRIEAGSSVAVVTQPWVDNSGVEQVAAVTSSKLTDLDTLAGTPVNPPSGQNPYTQAMEQNLGRLSSALGCNNNEQ